MSMVLTRSPLEPIGMNGAGHQKRRSARLSNEGVEDNEPPTKKSRPNGAHTTTVSTKEQDGGANGTARRKVRKAYDEEVDGFAFKKGGRKAKEAKQPPVRNSASEVEPLPAPPASIPEAMSAPASAPGSDSASKPAPVPVEKEEVKPKPAPKKTRRRFPTTPEREAAEKPVRRSKRLSDEHVSSDAQQSPHKGAHARSHAHTERSPSPDKARPITVEKKRKRGANGLEEEEKVMRIALPFQDTPVIRRNKEMRKTGLDTHRRSSSGMRGQRASSLIDEGRGNEASNPTASTIGRSNSSKQIRILNIKLPTPQTSESTSPALLSAPQVSHIVQDVFADPVSPAAALPHTEVSTEDFFKHISADVTEPRRMQCLLGWCGLRALPPKPDAPKDSTAESSLEFQALQAARVIQEELAQDLVSKGYLSDWFSRDETAPAQIALRKTPNPRNLANAVKAEELERELERLKSERNEWDELMQSAVPPASPAEAGAEADPQLSPLHPELLDSPQRAILEQLQAPTTDVPTDPEEIQQRLRNISSTLEFSIDQFAHGLHAVSTTKDVAERLAERTLADAADVLGEREKQRREDGKAVDAFDALKALGKVMNASRR